MRNITGYLLVLPALLYATAAHAGAERPYVAGNYFMQIDGVACGFVKSVEGGGISAEVVEEAVGPDKFVRKHIGQPKYEAVTVQITPAMSKAVYDWIVASLAMNYQRKTVAITACDYTQEAKSATEFFECLITEVGFPACDGGSKEPAYITLKFQPESCRVNPKASGKMGGEAGKTGAQKVWLPSNFALTIAGLGTSKVSKIGSFVIKQTVTPAAPGEDRIQTHEPGKLELPNLIVTFSEADSESWRQWHEEFLVKGNNGEAQEKLGTLTLLSANRQSELLKLTFHNLGICRLVSDKAEANADQIKRATAEMYCERIEMQAQPAGVGKDVEPEDTGKDVAPAE